MRLNARLGKLERVRSTVSVDMSDLTDEALMTGLREAVGLAGIDWNDFKSDPSGELRKKLESMPDDDLIVDFRYFFCSLGDTALDGLL